MIFQLKVSKTLYSQQKFFWQWLNIIFNQVDEQRIKEYGPDRTCAEWLLRNGASVKWTGSKEYLKDYNLLPAESAKRYIEEIDATDSSIMHYGFRHFRGCNHIKKLVLNRCNYIENEALTELFYLKNSLAYLHIISCGNLTEKGLIHLRVLENLKELELRNLPYVKDKGSVVKKLKESLIYCNVTFI